MTRYVSFNKATENIQIFFFFSNLLVLDNFNLLEELLDFKTF